MSEQKLTYMQRLDEWIDASVIMPLANPNPEDDFDIVVDEVRKAIHAKVLESYHNGQAAGPRTFRPARKETSHAKTQAS